MVNMNSQIIKYIHSSKIKLNYKDFHRIGKNKVQQNINSSLIHFPGDFNLRWKGDEVVPDMFTFFY